MATPKQSSNGPRRTGRRAPDMKPEYDFSRGTRGKYAARFAKMKLKIMLDPDVAVFFGTSKAVNDALRPLVRAKAGSRVYSTVRRRKAS